MALQANLSKKRKFVADGVFNCELNEFLRRELAEDGFSGLEVCIVHAKGELLCSRSPRQR